MITLTIQLTATQIIVAWIAYVIIWVILFIRVRRWCRKKDKEWQEKFKDKTVGFIIQDEVPGRYTEIMYSEQPWCDSFRNYN